LDTAKCKDVATGPRYLGADFLAHAIDEEKYEDVHGCPQKNHDEIHHFAFDVILDE